MTFDPLFETYSLSPRSPGPPRLSRRRTVAIAISLCLHLAVLGWLLFRAIEPMPVAVPQPSLALPGLQLVLLDAAPILSAPPPAPAAARATDPFSPRRRRRAGGYGRWHRQPQQPPKARRRSRPRWILRACSIRSPRRLVSVCLRPRVHLSSQRRPCLVATKPSSMFRSASGQSHHRSRSCGRSRVSSTPAGRSPGAGSTTCVMAAIRCAASPTNVCRTRSIRSATTPSVRVSTIAV